MGRWVVMSDYLLIPISPHQYPSPKLPRRGKIITNDSPKTNGVVRVDNPITFLVWRV